MTAKLLPTEAVIASRDAKSLPFRPVAPEVGARMSDPRQRVTSIHARGLLVGVALGLLLRVGLLLFAWHFFR
jgi:hypothetical protein